MTVAKYTNIGVAQLGANINTTDTTVTLLTPSDITSFPSISESWDYFRISLSDAAGNYEIMKVTSITGSNMTVERADEGTVARNWVTNDNIRLNGTAKLFNEIRGEGAGGEVVEKSSNFNLTPEFANKTIQTTDGITISLNPMVDFNDFSRIMIKNNSGVDVTVNPNGVETIDEKSSFVLKGKYSVEIYKGTSGWEIKTLSKTSAVTISKIYIQGLLLNRTDSDSLVLGEGLCSDSTGAIDLEVVSPLTCDTNQEIGLGDGGMPATVTKTGTFSTTGTAVVGTGTSFTTEFKKGDVLWSSSNDEGQVIVAVLTDTTMVTQLGFTVDVASDAVQKNGLVAFATYHSILAYNPTTDTNKLVLDTQINAENALADTEMSGYTVYRRVGSILTDDVKAIIDFTATETAGGGVSFVYKASIFDVSIFTLPTGSRAAADLSVPNGISINAKVNIAYVDNDDTDSFVKITTEGEDDLAANSSNHTLQSDQNFITSVETYYITNTSGQIYYRSDDPDSNGFGIQTIGYIDERTS